jgi:hypothetical protein
MVLTSLEIYEVDRYKRLLSTIYLERFPSRYRGLTESFPRRAGASYAQAPYTQVKTALDGKDINLAMIEVAWLRRIEAPNPATPTNNRTKPSKEPHDQRKRGVDSRRPLRKSPRLPQAGGDQLSRRVDPKKPS